MNDLVKFDLQTGHLKFTLGKQVEHKQLCEHGNNTWLLLSDRHTTHILSSCVSYIV